MVDVFAFQNVYNCKLFSCSSSRSIRGSKWVKASTRKKTIAFLFTPLHSLVIQLLRRYKKGDQSRGWFNEGVGDTFSLGEAGYLAVLTH